MPALSDEFLQGLPKDPEAALFELEQALTEYTEASTDSNRWHEYVSNIRAFIEVHDFDVDLPSEEE